MKRLLIILLLMGSALAQSGGITYQTNQSFQGAFPFPWTSIDSFFVVGASGNNTAYTVPAGKIGVARIFAFNPTVGAIIVFPTFTPVGGGGIIYRVGANISLPAPPSGSATDYQTNVYLILNAGDILGMNCAALGVNIYGEVLLADAVDSNKYKYKQVIFTNFIIGDNTVYTAPVGKTAYLSFVSTSPVSTIGNGYAFANETGVSVTYSVNFVPSGGSPSAANKILAPAALPTSSFSGNIVGLRKMVAGDFINLNTTSNGKQFFTAIVIETTP